MNPMQNSNPVVVDEAMIKSWLDAYAREHPSFIETAHTILTTYHQLKSQSESWRVVAQKFEADITQLKEQREEQRISLWAATETIRSAQCLLKDQTARLAELTAALTNCVNTLIGVKAFMPVSSVIACIELGEKALHPAASKKDSNE